MTTAGTRMRAPMRAAGPAHAGLRLLCLYLTSRRATGALAMIVAGAIALGFASHSRATAQVLPLVIETAAAMVIAATTSSPFGGPECATGRWLPYLRLTAVTTLTGATIAVLSVGSATTHASGGALGVMRDVAGLTGVGLLAAAFVGGGLAWTGLMTYLVIAHHAMSAGWTTSWTWPARPPHDRGAAMCAALVFMAGTAIITTRGAHDSTRE
jgi:hypothetical protein